MKKVFTKKWIYKKNKNNKFSPIIEIKNGRKKVGTITLNGGFAVTTKELGTFAICPTLQSALEQIAMLSGKGFEVEFQEIN